jgi:ATP-dependent exoDNAse (exonuclease V) beta subunit
VTVSSSPIQTRLEVRSASAGTGKTTSLVLEYLRALQFVPARRISAVTFTRVGAIDLRERLRAGLRQVVLEGQYLDFKPDQLEPYRRALREIGSATITTIHGFYRELLRLNAPALGLDPEFGNLDEGEALETFRDAASSALAEVALRDAPGGAILAAWGWERTLKALESLHQRRVYAPFTPGEHATELELALLELYTVSARGYTNRLAGRSLGPTDVELETLRLLEIPSALERIRSRHRVLLVDEFQDVNPLQAKIFSSLQLERVLLVGDAKQSIYAFRDADVNAFLDVYAKANRLEPLMTSYRHGPELCALYSSVAEKLFPEFLEAGLPPGVDSGRKEVSDGEPHAELHVFEASSLEIARRTEARFLAERLVELHRAGTPWSEMAVLVRSRTALPPLEAAFSMAGVPVLTVAGQRYYDRREIRDAATLLRLRVIPDSSPALVAAAVLPGIGIEPALLEEMLTDTRGLPTAIRASQDAAVKRLRDLLELAREADDAVSLLAEAWVFLGPSAFTRDRQSTANLDGLLFQLAARGLRDPRSALQFLERARFAEAEGDEPLEAGEAVRLLTVHASKGLEFGVTALFDIARGERNSTDDLAVHPDGELALKPERHAKLTSTRFAEINAHWAARRDGESNRLLYVAMTRAKDRLIITGSKTNKPRAWLETLLTMLKLESGEHGIPGIRVETHKVSEQTTLEPIQPSPPVPRFSVNQKLAQARFGKPAPRVRAPTRSPEAQSKEDEALELTDEIQGGLPTGDPLAIPDAERVVGTLTHYAIAENLSPENPTHKRVLEAQYLLHPYPPHERTQLLERAWVLVVLYENLYADRTDRLEDHAEIPFAFQRKGVTWQGIIDRLYLEPTGTWVLEDYKTDDLPPESLSQRERAYHRQLALYREAVRLARPEITQLEVRLTFLRFGLVMRLEDSDMDAALERA